MLFLLTFLIHICVCNSFAAISGCLSLAWILLVSQSTLHGNGVFFYYYKTISDKSVLLRMRETQHREQRRRRRVSRSIVLLLHILEVWSSAVVFFLSLSFEDWTDEWPWNAPRDYRALTSGHGVSPPLFTIHTYIRTHENTDQVQCEYLYISD